MATQSSLSQLTCEVLRLRLMEERGRPRDLVRGMEHFLCCTSAGIPVIRSAAGQVSDNHVPVVFVLSSRGLYKI